MKKYISTFVLVILVLVLVGGLGYSLNIIIKKDKEIVRLGSENLELRDSIKNLNDNIEKKQNEENIKVEEEIKQNKKIDIVFNENNISNKKENMKIYQDISDSMSVLSINVDTENNSLIIDLNKELAKLIYGYTDKVDSHTITGFSQKIVDAQITIIGDDKNDLNVVLLMEDGTVKYLSIDNILDKSYTVKSITDYKGYVKITKVIIENKDGVKYGIVGIKGDGTSDIIEF